MFINVIYIKYIYARFISIPKCLVRWAADQHYTSFHSWLKYLLTLILQLISICLSYNQFKILWNLSFNNFIRDEIYIPFNKHILKDFFILIVKSEVISRYNAKKVYTTEIFYIFNSNMRYLRIYNTLWSLLVTISLCCIFRWLLFTVYAGMLNFQN